MNTPHAAGVFTQDLAQDLPQEAIALDLVLQRAREHDFTISDEQARDVMGALGLTAAKALRPIGVLSGGTHCSLLSYDTYGLFFKERLYCCHAVVTAACVEVGTLCLMCAQACSLA
jgi:hypothetical protein